MRKEVLSVRKTILKYKLFSGFKKMAYKSFINSKRRKLHNLEFAFIQVFFVHCLIPVPPSRLTNFDLSDFKVFLGFSEY